MKALFLEAANQPFRQKECNIPVPGQGQVLVRVLASGVNPLDIKIRAGQAAHAQVKFPAILGIDMSGIVENIGEGVSAFKRGDEVYGMVGGVGDNQGSLSQYMAIDASLIALKPRNISFTDAAALPLVSITAWEAIVDRGNLQKGESVLIQGGAGGVGHIAIQLALSLGAKVFATAAPNDMLKIEKYGATPINYASEPPEKYMEHLTHGNGFDLVLDTVGGSVLDNSFKVVKRYTGRVVSILGWGAHNLAPLSFRGASYSGVFTLYPLIYGEHRQLHGNILKKIAALVEEGKVFPDLHDTIFTMSTIEDAYETIAGRRATGKVVVSLE